MTHPYIFATAVVILIMCLYFTFKIYSDTADGKLVDLSYAIGSYAMLGAYASTSFLYLACR